MMNKYYYLLFISFFFFISANAQTPFVCDDKLYMALVANNNEPSVFYEIVIAENNDQTTVLFDPLQNMSSHFLNAVGYRRTDNLIYGMRSLSNEIYAVDATGESFFIGNISGGNAFASYAAGDISSDGKNLILLEGVTLDEKLVIVDLESPTFDATTIEMTLASDGSPSDIRCADIAIDPTDGTLYGYDHFHDKLVSIDVNTGIINDDFSGASSNPGVMGALFFNSFGELFGYGRPQGGSFQNTLYRIDKTTGVATAMESGPSATGNDGCSCPYTININKEVFPTEISPCGEVEYTFTISNLTGSIQNNIDFTDLLPTEMTVLEIVENPFEGNIISGIGTNELIIEDMTLPIGKNELVVKVQVNYNATGTLTNQATLTDLPMEFGGVRLSDDPSTLEQDDPTALEVIVPTSSMLPDITETISVCNNAFTPLIPDQAAEVFLWSDGSMDSILEISETGIYTVDAIYADCKYYTHVFIVEESFFELQPFNDLTINEGDSIQLIPQVTSSVPFSVEWNIISNDLETICENCPQLIVSPLLETQYQVTVTNEIGCQGIDTILVMVEKSRDIFIPNAFSPNNDGFNDIFYVHTEADQKVELKIFDRWGAVVFEESCFTNDASCGWNGRFSNEKLNSGVFIYFAKIEFPDGTIVELQGDISLVN